MNNPVSPTWAAAIRKECASLMADEDHIHNSRMHKYILEVWERDSPAMWKRLTAAQLTGPLAYVLQARMWDQQKALMRAGLPVTDAREMAERENLMLEPESDNQETESDNQEAEQQPQ